MSYLDNGKKMTGPRDDSDLALRRFVKGTITGQTGYILGGLLDMVTSKPFLHMGCTQCHPRVLGSYQKACRSLPLSSLSGAVQGFSVPHSGSYFDSPHETLVAVSQCSGQIRSGPHHQGPDRFAFFEVYARNGI